ncbi:MAG: T9SS type A sorting domain-containing protein [Bacteroidia bacterium]|jgi:hypothetical protein|nr:T9SS type A sorting domain-containing protein [Bacteroidia bacterium]
MKKLFTTIAIGLALFTQAQNYPTTGLVAYYPLNGTGVDRSGNDNHLTATSVALKPGLKRSNDSSTFFNGTQNSIMTGNVSAINTQTYTISAWVKLDSLPNTYANIFEGGSNSIYLRFLKGSLGEISAQYGYKNTSSSYLGVSRIVMKKAEDFFGSWHMITAVREYTLASEYKIILYLDGVVLDQFSMPQTEQVGFAGTNVSVGGRSGTSTLSTYGCIQDIFLYNRSLTTFEIEDLYELNNDFNTQGISPITGNLQSCGNTSKTIIPSGVFHKIAWFVDLDGEGKDFEKKPISATDTSFSITNSSITVSRPSDFPDAIYTYTVVGDGYFQDGPVSGFTVTQGPFINGTLTLTLASDSQLTIVTQNIPEGVQFQLLYNDTPLGNPTLDLTFTNSPRFASGVYKAVASPGVCNIMSNQVTVSPSTSIAEQQLPQVHIYPNPVNTSLHLQINTTLLSVTLYTINGKPVLTTNEALMNTANIADGIYFLIVETTGGVTTQKVVITH